ncbi:MAG: sulfotransferase family 2 domain-containing protein [Chlamydiia bacterium]|nr:sulfotransferase family 2 domain-containing protein [Chlamydiia bacterium]
MISSQTEIFIRMNSLKYLLYFFLISFSCHLNAEIKTTNDLIVFYHIRKCGGTTLFTTLEKKYFATEVHASREWDRIDCNKLKFLRAHLQFHETSPLFPNAKNITMLREPISRVVSSYCYWLENHKFWPKDKQQRTFPLNESNEAVKMLSDFSPDDPNVTLVDHLKSAKNNLQNKFYFVGIMERMDESVETLFRLLGFKHEKKIPILNTTIVQPSISKKILQKIKKQNWADSELYEFATKIFEKKIQEALKYEIVSLKSEPQKEIHYSFMDPLDGEGWGFREGKGFRKTIGKWVKDALYDRVFRTSYKTKAWVDFSLDPTLEYRLKFTCASPLPQNLRDLIVEIDGQPIEIQRETFGVWSTFTAKIEKGRIKQEPARLTFRVPLLYRPSDHDETPDNRYLGIALSKIHWTSTQRSEYHPRSVSIPFQE